MKIERSKNASRNVFFGIIQTAYNQLMPFILRTIMIHVMGVEYLGLNSLFTSILSVLNLAELGVGSAMVFSMYKPIVEDDTKTICALMKLYKTYYRIIGSAICVVGLIITPFIPKLIKGDVPSGLNIYILYLMNLGATVLTYWLFAYKNCLLTAHQRNDVTSKIGLAVSTVTYTLQILSLVITHNYYLYLIVALLMNAINNVVTALIVDKMFPEYHAIGKLPKERISSINKKVKDLFTAKLGTIIINSVDTIVISAFLGLRDLAIYQNYYYILNAVFGFVTIIFNACTAGIGNSLIVESEDKNLKDLNKFTLLTNWISCFCCCCFMCLYQPFIELWVGKDNMLTVSYVPLFVLYFYLKLNNQLLCTYKDAGGIWHEDRFRPIASALTDLTLNLILVNFIGLYGIILSTIIALLFVATPWLYKNVFTVLFKKGFNQYVKKELSQVLLIVFSVGSCYLVSSVIKVNSLIITIIVRLFICVIVPNLIFFIVFRKKSEFYELLILADNITKGKFGFAKKVGKN